MNPVAVILYDHYLKLQENVTQAQLEEKLMDVPQQKIREARQLADEKLLEALEERPLTDRQFDDSSKLNKFLKSLMMKNE